jgi:hypothetical protein
MRNISRYFQLANRRAGALRPYWGRKGPGKSPLLFQLHCYRYLADRVPPRTSLKSRQGAGHASTCCHTSHSFGPHLPAREGSGAAMPTAAPYPTSLLRRAPVLPRIPRLWTLPPNSGGIRRCHASHGSLQAVNKEMLGCNEHAVRLTCYRGECKTFGQTMLS